MNAFDWKGSIPSKKKKLLLFVTSFEVRCSNDWKNVKLVGSDGEGHIYVYQHYYYMYTLYMIKKTDQDVKDRWKNKNSFEFPYTMCITHRSLSDLY